MSNYNQYEIPSIGGKDGGATDEIKLRKNVSAEDLESVKEIEDELKGRSEPKLIVSKVLFQYYLDKACLIFLKLK